MALGGKKKGTEETAVKLTQIIHKNSGRSETSLNYCTHQQDWHQHKQRHLLPGEHM